MAEYKVEPHLPSSQTTQAPGGSIIIMLPTKAVVGFLATLAIAKAAKLNEDSLYHVVEDLPANETVEASEENVATCSDIMARNGLVSLLIIYTVLSSFCFLGSCLPTF